MRKPALILLLALAACEGETKPMGFFDNFKASELGTTKLIAPHPTTGTKGDWVKMIDLVAPDKDAAEVRFSVRSEYSIDQPQIAGGPSTGLSNVGGPLVARIRWGTGGGYNIIEFDVPPSRLPANFSPLGLPPNQPVDDLGNGVTIALSGAAFTLELRNDANLSTLTNPAGNSLSAGGVSPVKAIAFASPSAPSEAFPVRRIITVAGGFPNAPLAPGATVVVTIPSFAHRVQFLRIPIATVPLHIITTDAFGLNVRERDIPVNVDGEMELNPRELNMTIRNDGAVNCVVLNAAFDVSPQ